MSTTALRNTGTLAWRTLVQLKHNPFELMDFSFQPVVFLLLFTYVFGGAIAGSPGEYLTFGLAGIIVQNMLFSTLNTGVGLNTDISTPTTTSAANASAPNTTNSTTSDLRNRTVRPADLDPWARAAPVSAITQSGQRGLRGTPVALRAPSLASPRGGC